jgi:DNA polymerase III subunit beta
MKFSTLHQNLQQGVKIIQKAVPNKPQLPILNSILISVTKKSVTFLTTDLYFGVKVEISASVSEEGSCTVPGKLFTEAVLTLGNGKISISLDKTTLKISSDSGVDISLPADSAQDFPDFPDQEGEPYSFTLKTLKDIQSLVGFSSAQDQARVVLNTVFLENFEASLDSNKLNKLRAVSTDGFRLSVLDIKVERALKSKFLIPVRAVTEVTRIAEQQDQENIDCSFSDNLKQVFFKVGRAQFYARLIEGDFPPYQKIMPSIFAIELAVDTQELLQKLKQASIFARDVSNIVQFSVSLSDSQLEVSAKGSQGSYLTNLPVEIEESTVSDSEKNFKIAFNVKYILDFLQTQNSEQIWIGLSESLKPAMFKSKKNSNFQYIVMPFRLNA